MGGLVIGSLGICHSAAIVAATSAVVGLTGSDGDVLTGSDGDVLQGSEE